MEEANVSRFGRPSPDDVGWPAPGSDQGEEPVYAPHAGGPRPRSAIRASDADREAAATELRRHFATGRLDSDELAERLSAAYAARTHGNLDKLFVDLPGRPRSAAAPVPERAYPPRRRSGRRLLVPVAVALALIWVASGAGQYHRAGWLVGGLLLAVCFWCLLLRLAFRAVEGVHRAAYHAGLHRGRSRGNW